jgi:hypothetical protein
MTSTKKSHLFEITPRYHRGRDDAPRPVLLSRSVNENCAFNGVTDNAQLIAQAESEHPVRRVFADAQ